HASGKYSRYATGTLACSWASETLTATWQFSCLPSTPQYWRATPTECRPFFGDPRIVDHPGRHRPVAFQGRQHCLPADAQDGRIVPGGVRHEMMHRLMRGAQVAGIHPRRHGFDALPVSRQTQPGDIVPERAMAVLVAEGAAEPLNIRVKPLAAGTRGGGHTPRLPAYPMISLTLLTQ